MGDVHGNGGFCCLFDVRFVVVVSHLSTAIESAGASCMAAAGLIHRRYVQMKRRQI